MSEPLNHRVRVEVVHGDPVVTFMCDAPADASCRTYPDSEVCTCETWSDRGGKDAAGHPFKAGQQCWLIDFFDAGAIWFSGEGGDPVTGNPPAEAKEGMIVTDFDDSIAWQWADEVIA